MGAAIEGDFTMNAYPHFAMFAILVSVAGFDACTSSNSPASMGSGGSTSAGGTGGSGGGTTASCHAAGTLTVTNQGMTAYVIDSATNPTLTLCRGSTYTFAVNATGHPFYIKTVQGAGTADAYSTGVTGNGADVGNVVFVVDSSAPSTLFYDCSLHAAMTGTINIVDKLSP